MVVIEKAQIGHIAEILNNLRAHDKELINLCKNPEEVMEEQLKRSNYSFTGFIDGDIACMWGIQTQTILNDSAYLWLITTRLVDEHPFIFVRHSQLVARALLSEFSRIHGWVLEGNIRSINWLKWIGCSFSAGEVGVLEFNLMRKQWQTR